MANNDRIRKGPNPLSEALKPLVAERLGLLERLSTIPDSFRVGHKYDDDRKEEGMLQRLKEIRQEENQIRFEHRVGALHLIYKVNRFSDINEVKDRLDFLPPGHEVIIRPVKKINGDQDG